MMRKEFKAYEQNILDCRAHFEQMLLAISHETDEEAQQVLAKKAIGFACRASTGYYSSDIIENVFIRLAQKHSLDTSLQPFKKGAMLHVMTESYETGGHTRVVERWIELADATQTHSLVLTGSTDIALVPERLKAAIAAKNGSLVCFKKSLSELEKSLKLREMGASYEYVILHVHMDDVVPLIAFGTEEFTRPVLFYNHADHLFWVGVSIADMLVDLRSWGQELSVKKRGVQHSFILGIPIDIWNSKRNYNKDALRDSLNIAKDKKIIMSVGSPHKYKALLGLSLVQVIEKILTRHVDIECILVGAFFDTLDGWEEVAKKFSSRIHAVGSQPPEKMFEYLGAADLVLDSWPMCGGTALIDAVSCGKPVLSLQCPTGQLDYIMNSTAYCETVEILIDKLSTILHDKCVAEEYIQNVQEQLVSNAGQDVWAQRMQALYASVTTHKVRTFSTPTTTELTDLDAYLYSERNVVKRKLHIPHLVTLYSYKNNGKHYKELIFFDRYTWCFATRKLW